MLSDGLPAVKLLYRGFSGKLVLEGLNRLCLERPLFAFITITKMVPSPPPLKGLSSSYTSLKGIYDLVDEF